jgi:hypothetical protein
MLNHWYLGAAYWAAGQETWMATAQAMCFCIAYWAGVGILKTIVTGSQK